jgi:hypothetical protein
MSEAYLPPVYRLLALGAEPARRRTWPDYRPLGLEERHVPALIRMATDAALYAAPERDRAGWAPVHAARALAQLGAAAAAAAEPLLALLERRIENDWVLQEIPAVLGMIGPAAIPGATLMLFDEERDENARVAAADVLAGVGLHHPERADEAAAVLAKQLEDWPRQSPRLNAYLVMGLVDLGATDAAPLMEQVYAAGAVDVDLAGDWEDAQVDLGLLPERTTVPPHGGWHRAGSRRPAADAAAKAKARRKEEKQARKRNRKKKK